MGQLTTHVLDTTEGSPARGVRIEIHDLQFDVPLLINSFFTGEDGRCRDPLLAGADLRKSRYSITFYIAEYFRSRGVVLPMPAFIEDAAIRIGIANPDEHYHVPLLVSPWSYSVYRGG